MCQFEVGKKVIAVKAAKYFKRGDVFTLTGIRKGFCGCAPVLLDVGIRLEHMPMRGCCKCEKVVRMKTNVGWFASEAFLPYDDSLSDMTVEQVMREAGRELRRSTLPSLGELFLQKMRGEAQDDWDRLSL